MHTLVNIVTYVGAEMGRNGESTCDGIPALSRTLPTQ